MNKNNVVTKPSISTKISFEELYSTFAADWEIKAESLRARRWKHIKQKLF